MTIYRGLGLDVNVDALANAMLNGQIHPTFTPQTYTPAWATSSTQSIDANNYVDDSTANQIAGLLGASVVKKVPINAYALGPVPQANTLQFGDGSLVNAGQVAALASYPESGTLYNWQHLLERNLTDMANAVGNPNMPEPGGFAAVSSADATSGAQAVQTPVDTPQPVPQTSLDAIKKQFSAPVLPVSQAVTPILPAASSGGSVAPPSSGVVNSGGQSTSGSPAATCWSPLSSDTSACWGPVSQTTALIGIGLAVALFFFSSGGKR